MRLPRAALPTLLLAVTLVAAACGGNSAGLRASAAQASDVETGDRPEIAPGPESAGSPLPPVVVWDVGESDWVQFADYLPSDRPLLVWFWAPHCPACAAEAPGMVEFAREHGDRVDVVGLGTQDDAGLAATFVDRHDIPFPMLWDETFDTWRAFGITAQPAAVLLSGDGEVLGGWLGGLPENEVLRLTA